MPESAEEFVVYSLVAVVSVVATRLVSRRSEKIQKTMETFRYYNSPNVLKARNVSWKFLKVDYPKNPTSFDTFFSDQNVYKEVYNDLSTVLYFWMSLYAMKKEGAISRKLAHHLFYVQYRDWEAAIRPLYEKSKTGSNYLPDWFVIFEDGNMDWLLRG